MVVQVGLPRTARRKSRSSQEAISIQRARDLIAERVTATATIELSVPAAVHHVLAADVRSTTPLPAFDNSAMDGFAVVSSGQRCIDGAIVIDAHAFRTIFTGHPVAPPFDAVARAERARLDAYGSLHLDEPVLPGADVRHAGEELAADEIALPRGSWIGPAAIGMLAAIDVASVLVHHAPRVALLVTGDEIHRGSGMPAHGQVPDADGPMLRALLADAYSDLVVDRWLPDDATRLRDAIASAMTSSDLICISGGAAGSARDHAARLVADMGEMVVDGLLARPGSPTRVAHAGQCWLVALPGNPLAALAGFEAVVRPALRALAGATEVLRPRISVPLLGEWRHDDRRERLVPVRLGRGDATVAATLPGGSAMLRGAATADGMAFIPPGARRERTISVPVEVWS